MCLCLWSEEVSHSFEGDDGSTKFWEVQAAADLFFIERISLQLSLMRRFLLICVVAVLLLGGAKCQSSYSSSFNTIEKYQPMYNLGYITSGYTVMANLSSPGTSGASAIDMSQVDFTLETNTFPFQSVTCVKTCSSTTACSYDCPISSSAIYRANITKANTPADTAGTTPNVLQYFQLSVGTYLTSADSTSVNILLTTNEVVRDRVVRLVYVDFFSAYSFSLYPVQDTGSATPDLSNTNIHLFKVNSVQGTNNVYDISGATELLTTAGTETYSGSRRLLQSSGTGSSLLLEYKINLAQGFYVLVYSYDTTNVNLVRVSFQTSPYVCPYGSLTDQNLNFQGCSAQTSSPSFFENNIPFCISFDQRTGICAGCQTGYLLKDNLCNLDTSCKTGFYYHFGDCTPVDPSCGSYNANTGFCITCATEGYIINGTNCIPDPRFVVCTSRQYKLNNHCFGVSPLCGAFDNTNGNCLTCSLPNYVVIQSGDCVLNETITPVEPVLPTCLGDQYISPKNLCKDIPINCVSFNRVTELCQECAWGLAVDFNGLCATIQCDFGLVLAFNGKNCIPMPLNCQTYDSTIGQCTQCTGTLYILQNGQCKEVTGGGLSGCQQREALGFGSCEDAKINCANYNLNSGNCQACLAGWSFDFKGACTVEEAKVICRSDEQKIQGICLQKPLNCITIDKRGLCSKCDVNYRLSYGVCNYRPICGPKQYRNSSGRCQDVIANCSYFNPSDGQCLQCINSESPVSNICCSVPAQRVISGVCQVPTAATQAAQAANNANNNLVFSPANFGGFGSRGGFDGGSATTNEVVEPPSCVLRHPSMGYCLQCNANYEVNPANLDTCQ